MAWAANGLRARESGRDRTGVVTSEFVALRKGELRTSPKKHSLPGITKENMAILLCLVAVHPRKTPPNAIQGAGDSRWISCVLNGGGIGEVFTLARDGGLYQLGQQTSNRANG